MELIKHNLIIELRSELYILIKKLDDGHYFQHKELFGGKKQMVKCKNIMDKLIKVLDYE